MNVCFNGCSLTVGEGFPADQRDSYIYDRLLEKKFCFNRTNVAKSGSSNYEIFMRTADAIMSDRYQCIVTQWSALNRLWLYPGPDTEYSLNSSFEDYRYRHIFIGAKDKEKLTNTILLLNGDYHNIISLVKFTHILKTIAKTNGTKLVFVNGLVPWQDDLITPLSNDLNSSLSEYTKSVLDFDNRDDSEIIKFFLGLQKFVQQIDQSLWVNLFNSWQNNIIDIGPEGHHPGIHSHQWMADRLSEYFVENKIL